MTSENIVVDISCQCDDIEIDIERLEKLVRDIVSRFHSGMANVSVAIVDDETITKIHKRFLGKDTTTDSISFDLSDETDGAKIFDSVVNAQLAVRQSQKRNHDPQAELALYVTHGLLHNLGFDDMDESTAAEMHAMEDEILRQAGFGAIYSTDEINGTNEV